MKLRAEGQRDRRPHISSATPMMMRVGWNDVEPWFDDLRDWITLSTSKMMSIGRYSFTAWQLTLVIQSEICNVNPVIGGDSPTLPYDLAVCLRELLEIMKEASTSSDLTLWGEITRREGFSKTYHTPSLTILSGVWLRFECGGTSSDVAWLDAFRSVFFRPLEELSTSDTFKTIMSKLQAQQKHDHVVRIEMIKELEPKLSRGNFALRHYRLCFASSKTIAWEADALKDFIMWTKLTELDFRENISNLLPIVGCRPRNLQVHLHWGGLPMNSTAVRLLHDLFDASSSLGTTMDWNATCTSQYDCTGMPRLDYALTEAGNQSTLTLLNPFDYPISEECVTVMCEVVRETRLFPRFQIGRVNVELNYLDRVFAALCQPDDPVAVEIGRKGMVTITLPGSSLSFELDSSDKAACIGWL